jgi:hypothetical protein
MRQRTHRRDSEPIDETAGAVAAVAAALTAAAATTAMVKRRVWNTRDEENHPTPHENN